MLAICFGLSVFTSFLWAFYSISFVLEKLGAASFSSLSIPDFSIYIAIIILPIFLIWAIFGYAMQFLFNKNLHKNLYHLFQQMKKNQDYTDVVARLILESERQAKDGFILDKFDTLIADLNEILSEIIQKTKIASPEQIDTLWQKVQNGGKWSFAKLIIEVWQNQSNFLTRVLEKASEDIILSGSILEFCARYLNLVALLEKHDKDKVFLNIIEAGVMGKVFSIFAPIDDEIKKRRGLDDVKSFQQKEEKATQTSYELSATKDDYSLAFERTFGAPQAPMQPIKDVAQQWEELQKFSINLQQEEPTFEISMNNDLESIKEAPINSIENTTQQSANQDDKEDNQAYPFGNWMAQ